MNYDTIIVEMLSRIQALENQVKALTSKTHEEATAVNVMKKNKSANPIQAAITTADIRQYIEKIKADAKATEKTSITLVAREIHNDLKLKQCYPMVCNAMKQCMIDGVDEYVHITPSGYSSTLEIKYYL